MDAEGQNRGGMKEQNEQDVQDDTQLFKPGYLPLEKIKSIYGISVSYLYKLRYERRLFHYSLGARTFINIEELEALICNGKKK